MTISLTIAIVTGVLVCASVVFLPSLKLGRIRLGTYWLASLVGAIRMSVLRGGTAGLRGAKPCGGHGGKPCKDTCAVSVNDISVGVP